MTDGYLIRSAEIWDQARGAYLAGQSAPAVCERYGIGLSAFRLRARKEGWRRSDMPDPELDDPEEEIEEIGHADLGESMRIAAWRMASAVRRGMVHEAASWGRIHEICARQVVAQERATVRVETVQRRARERESLEHYRGITAAARGIEAEAKAALATYNATLKVHDLHDLHPVSDPASATPADDARKTRADRRRAERAARKRR